MRPSILSERLAHLVPYTPGEQPRDGELIKLNTNENPYPPSPQVCAALTAFDAALLSRYPDPTSAELRQAVAESLGLEREQVFAGNGSDEVLSLAFFAFFDGRHGPLLFPEFTYSFYPVFCNFYGIPFRKVPLAEDFSVDARRFLAAGRSCGIAFANPNAPTGIAIGRGAIEELLDRYPKDRVVLVDEAYVDYGAESCVPLLRSYDNLLIVHTYSKSRSLAGMRLGFALGSKPLVDALTTAKDSFNSYPLDRIAQVVGAAAARSGEYYAEVNRRVTATRDSFARETTRIGYRVLPSSANFVFLAAPGGFGKELAGYLRERRILVRHFAIPGIEAFVRISIGTDEQMARLLEGLRSFADGKAR